MCVRVEREVSALSITENNIIIKKLFDILTYSLKFFFL